MNQRLVLAGGGHAHMVTLANLRQFVDKGHEVTVIGPSEYHYYSGMGPGMLGGTYSPEEIRFATRHVVEKYGGTFIRGKVTGIDPQNRSVQLDSGQSLPYDVLSCNLGSQVPRSILTDDMEDVYPVKPIERLLKARQRILDLSARKELFIAVVGGGPSAVEIAGNVRGLVSGGDRKPVDVKVLAKTRLMPNHPEGVRRRAYDSLKKRHVEIIESCEITEIKTGRLTDASGETYAPDIIFVAVGVKPNPVFKESGIPTGPDGGMKVNRFLQSIAHREIFGGGDCIHFADNPLDKVGVYAVRQNPLLFQNLMAALEGGELRAFSPGGRYLLIFNMGDGTGIFHKWGIQFNGKPAFRIKDYIDRKFMREFQKIE
jgi:NADH dehydrogenase FAD-containing subunit